MDGELLSLKWNNHRTTFYHIISSLRNKESYTDVTLACDGKFYPAHKFVLSTCSEYFSEIFVRTPCKNPVVVLKDIQCRDLEFLLDYMYIGEVNVRQNELTSLIKAAECLRVKGLAVPDEEPKTSSSNSSARQRPEHSSPPAKRRRAEERRSTSVVNDQSPGRPPGDVPLGSPDQRETRVSNVGGSVSGDVQDNNSEIVDTIVIKEEKDTQDEISLNVQNSYEEGDDKGDVPQDSEGNSTGDFPDFLSSTIEKEEPEFTSDFAGPSGLQNSNVTPWESENSATSFPEGISGSVAAAVAAVSQPQQRQQQQLWPWPSTQADEEGAIDVVSEFLMGEGSLQDPGGPGEGLGGGGGGGAGDVVVNPGKELGTGTSSSSSSRWECPYCGYVAQRRLHLESHIRTHTGERPHQCPHCPYRCSEISNLRKHIKVHSTDKPFACSHCSFTTKTSSSLKKHMLRHTVDDQAWKKLNNG